MIKWCIVNLGWCFCYVTRLLFFLQLSQLEDPRRPSGDLPCAAQVRLQPLRRHRRCRPHPQVASHVDRSVAAFRVINFYCAGIALWTRMGLSAMGQVCRSSRRGGTLLAISLLAGSCCGSLCVGVLVETLRMLCHPLPSSCRGQDSVQEEVKF